MSRLLVPVFVAALLSSTALAQEAVKENVGEAPKGKAPAQATEPSAPAKTLHDVISGDTLWGLSDRYWNSRAKWPKLWSFNPQIHNPHWIFPGDKISLVSPPPPPVPEPVVREIPLVVEKLKAPEPVAADKTALAKEAATRKSAQDAAEKVRRTFGLVEWRSQDYLATEKVDAVGVVENRQLTRTLSAELEEIQLSVNPGVSLAVGDMLTAYDDSREIIHPLTGAPVGRLVRVVGQVKIIRVEKDGLWGRITTSYDIIEEGQSLMKYREPVASVVVADATARVSGIVLAGGQSFDLITYDDLAFLDKGSDDGLVVGTMVDIPFPAGPIQAEGYTDRTDKPIARGVVVSIQPKTSTVWIMESRKAVEPGFRFIASADSP